MQVHEHYVVYVETKEEAKEVKLFEDTILRFGHTSNPLTFPAAIRIDLSTRETGYTDSQYYKTFYKNNDQFRGITKHFTFKEWKDYITALNINNTIAGYKLLKELPRLKVGTLFTSGKANESYSYDDYTFSKAEVESYTEWFEPVFKEKEVRITCVPLFSNSFDFVITKEKIIANGVNMGQNPHVEIPIRSLESLVKTPITYLQHWAVLATHVQVGCKSGVPIKTLEEVYDAYLKLQVKK